MKNIKSLKQWYIDCVARARSAMERFADGFADEFNDSNFDRSEGFFQLTFALLASMVRADGMVDPKEEALVAHYVDSHFNFSEERRALAWEVFNEALASSVEPVDYASALEGLFATENERVLLEIVFEVLFEVALADGVLAPEEERQLKRIAKVFQINKSKFNQIRERTLGVLSGELQTRYFNLLESESDSSFDRITDRYQALLRRYDLTRMREQGLPDEFLLLVRKRLEEIEEAYAALRLQFV